MYACMSLICGVIFGLGLTISNMTNPYKVLNFLDVFGAWDGTLLVVMVAALLVTFIGYRLVLRASSPKLTDRFFIPERTKIEPRLIAGSIIFGLGWGIAGYCPGPGITALSLLSWDPLLFVSGMILGSFSFYFLNRMRN